MKRIALILLLALSSITITEAQKKAVTEIGEEVILFDDGTWKYKNDTDSNNAEIPTNSKAFLKDDNSTFLLKSSKLDYGFWLNPKIWSFNKAIDNTEAEYEFQLKDEDLYGMAIVEKVEIPLENLKSIALENARSAAPDIRVVQEEYRIVNGLKVLLLQLDGTTQGIKFSYYGYYFSSTKGTIQFITYTSQDLLDDFRKTCEDFLNGFVELN